MALSMYVSMSHLPNGLILKTYLNRANVTWKYERILKNQSEPYELLHIRRVAKQFNPNESSTCMSSTKTGIEIYEI